MCHLPVCTVAGGGAAAAAGAYNPGGAGNSPEAVALFAESLKTVQKDDQVRRVASLPCPASPCFAKQKHATEKRVIRLFFVRARVVCSIVLIAALRLGSRAGRFIAAFCLSVCWSFGRRVGRAGQPLLSLARITHFDLPTLRALKTVFESVSGIATADDVIAPEVR